MKCYKCVHVGNVGKRDTDGSAIAWCLLKSCIVDPDVGCNRGKVPQQIF